VKLVGDGPGALPVSGLARAALAEPVICILDWWQVSVRVQHIEQALRGVYGLNRGTGRGWRSSSAGLDACGT
jgi:hypothetical protein